MGHALKPGRRRPAHALGRGAGVDQLRMGSLQRQQAIEECIVFPVADLRGIKDVIGVIVFREAVAQGLRFPARRIQGRAALLCAPLGRHRGLGRDIWRRWNSRMR